MKKLCVVMVSAMILGAGASAQPARWRPASERELRSVIPARATVEAERIETEMRTASGVTDGSGRFIAGVTMITAGYAAEGKYSNFFITHVPIRIGEVELRPGEYVFGQKRLDGSTLEVTFYEAANGKLVGAVKGSLDPKRGPVYSLAISPARNGEKPVIKIGRFVFEYDVR
jgi:hypothetical protein